MQVPETKAPLRVLIVGAGIGGLVLAHGLRRAGVAVTLFERDERPENTGGYRLHLDAAATRALRAQLPPTIYQSLLASASAPESFRQFTVLDRQLRPVLRLPRETDCGGDDLLIGRVPLRALLAHGLDDVITWNTTVVGTNLRADGTVEARLADGGVRTADLLVAADGARSPIAHELGNGPTALRLDVSGLAGRVSLTPALASRLPPALFRGPAFALGPGHGLLFLSTHDPRTSSVAADLEMDPKPILESPYLLWGFTLPGTTAEAGLYARAMAVSGSWSARVRDIVAGSDPAGITSYPYYVADPTRPVAPWAAGPITALGDAVHPMPPTGGRGAATAICDADSLVRHLIEVEAGRVTLVTAVHDFQRDMRNRATPAIRASLGPLRARRWLGRPAVAALSAAGRVRGALPSRPGTTRDAVVVTT